MSFSATNHQVRSRQIEVVTRCLGNTIVKLLLEDDVTDIGSVQDMYLCRVPDYVEPGHAGHGR